MTETDSEPFFTDQPDNTTHARRRRFVLLMVPWLACEGIERFEEDGCCWHD